MIKTSLAYIYYYNRLSNHIEAFGDDKDIFLTNQQYQHACSLIFIQIGEFVGRLSDDFKKNTMKYHGSQLKICETKMHITMII